LPASRVDVSTTSTCTERGRPTRDGLDRRSHITTALQKLHWLPVKYRVTFKIATIMHQTFQHRCPLYLSGLVMFASADSIVRQLRSSTTRAAGVKRSRTQFGRRAFSVVGPDIWNSLAANIRTIDSRPAFRRALNKTHLSAQHLTISFYIIIDIVIRNSISDVRIVKRNFIYLTPDSYVVLYKAIFHIRLTLRICSQCV